METNLEKIKHKISALLNRTIENGATKHEAETCIKLASQLMTKYMIEKHQLNDAKNEICVEKRVKLTRKNKSITTLSSSIAHTFDCEFLWFSKTGIFFGYSCDVDICIYIHDIAIRALESEIRDYKKSNEMKSYTTRGYNSRIVINDFIDGFCDSIRLKLFEVKDKRKNEIKLSTGTDLVLAKEQVVSQELGKAYPKAKKNKTKERKNQTTSYIDGREKGDKVSLNLAISQEQNKLVL